jgi:hypothetical protein
MPPWGQVSQFTAPVSATAVVDRLFCWHRARFVVARPLKSCDFGLEDRQRSGETRLVPCVVDRLTWGGYTLVWAELGRVH